MNTKLLTILAVFLFPSAAWAGSSESAPTSASELRLLGREWADARWNQSEPAPTSGGPRAKFGKIAQGFPSLILPGWSQWRQGHKTRAALFLGSEVAVWTSWLVFHVQGERREDSYADYAVQYAGVNGSNHDEEYWKAVAFYVSAADYNEDQRRNIRGGVEPEGPASYGPDQAWQWSSPERLDEFRQLRVSSLTAHDRAENVLALLLVTRAVAVADAIREAFLSDPDEPESEIGFHLRANPIRPEEGAEVGLRLRF